MRACLRSGVFTLVEIWILVIVLDVLAWMGTASYKSLHYHDYHDPGDSSLVTHQRALVPIKMNLFILAKAVPLVLAITPPMIGCAIVFGSKKQRGRIVLLILLGLSLIMLGMLLVPQYSCA